MEQTKDSKIKELCSRMAAIRTESDLLKKMILSKEEEDEENKILSDFDNTVQLQVFSTINNLVKYQLNGWRELVDEGDDGEDGTDTD